MEHLSQDVQGSSVGVGCAMTQALVFAVLMMSFVSSRSLQQTMRDRRSYEVADAKSQIQGKTEQANVPHCSPKLIVVEMFHHSTCTVVMGRPAQFAFQQNLFRKRL